MRIAALLIACAGLLACAPSKPAVPGGPSPSDAAASAGRLADPRLQLVYIVHGDADYVWHDVSGARRLADRDALVQALDVARRSAAAEVFVFHQAPRRRLSLHPSIDGRAWQFRRGALVSEGAYVRRGRGSDFAAEADWIRSRSRLAPDPVRFLAYFGHEIPAFGGLGYSRSAPREEFSLPRFARGLDRIAKVTESAESPAGARPFSLVVLSACRGGTPASTAALLPYADFLLASPVELHLSYLDTRAFIPLLSAEAAPEGWGPEARRIRVEAASLRMLRESFGGLSERTQAPIALALYEADKAAPFLEAHPAAVRGESAPGVRLLPLAWRDCGEDPEFGPGGEKAGAVVLYRPGRFGVLKAKAGHSGWECPRSFPVDGSGVEVLSTAPADPEEAPDGVTPAIPDRGAGPPDPVPPS